MWHRPLALEGVLGDCRASWSRAKKSTRDLLMVGNCIRVRIQVSIDSEVPKWNLNMTPRGLPQNPLRSSS
jgi:hypothetical protein